MEILIKAGKIIDGTGDEPIEQGCILIEDNIISQIGGEGDITLEGSPLILDVREKTVIPGLIDCHAHLCSGFNNFVNELFLQQEIADSVLLGVYNAGRCIKAGITTVRDAGCGHRGIFQIKEAVDSGKILGPRVLPCGTSIAITGGHGWQTNIQADGPTQVRKAVRSQLRWGAEAIKFLVTGGSTTRYEKITDVQFNLDELSAGVEEAKKRDKRTCAHVCNPEGALISVKAGIDSIDHGTIMNDKALNAMKNAGSFLVPTMIAYWEIGHLGEKLGFSEWNIRKAKEVIDYHREVFIKTHEMGVNIAMGTDSGNKRRPLGDSMNSELELAVKYGMEPIEAIKAATLMSARNLGIEKATGTLKKGKLADILITDGDPTRDISELRHVSTVLKEGKILYRV
jgi:imidazolonepropionase-like amidohydrolase